MRKSKKKPSAKKTKQQAAIHPPQDKAKRANLSDFASWGVLAAAVAGGGYWAVGSVLARMGEGDLSKIGQGVAAIVQIHDPNCSMCAQLMRSTRQALSTIEDGKLEYAVANIKTTEGRNFAARYNAPHVTLLLFDARGNLVQTINGIQQSATLEPIFERLSKGRIRPNG